VWGVELGAGIRTLVVTPAYYGLLALSVTQPSIFWAFAVAVLYGVSRGGVIVAFAEVARRLESSKPPEWEPGDGLEVKLRAPLAILIGLAVVSGFQMTP
jgi:hypothetical protein